MKDLAPETNEMKDLAPHIVRQRLVIEGISSHHVTSRNIANYLSRLSGALNMVTLIEPVTHRSVEFGWAGWIHWATSGAHFYAWDKTNFFSVDIYTCKPFSVECAVDFTRAFFNAAAIEFREF